uniref:Uncharacterized protein n=1 Tax=Arundo donax TaxID=35708 RepID=A0A0A9DN61_ARUDO
MCPMLSPTVGTTRSGGSPSPFRYIDFNFSSKVVLPALSTPRIRTRSSSLLNMYFHSP